MKNKLTAAFLATLMMIGLSACNTVQGVGEDMEAAGSAINKKAEETKGY
ncbi:putative small secreted protein [Methylophaga frappieri]|uniref:Putative small secreted protein n=1 Tax=Methylophaga frappieri (strain ATCC BAA-2434 / DSM 25690 / JAM7) TaxID=754477 RepID=I1YJT1_METFJ|nr:entericidin A/B family lipoprotein [Methylophaga frappieri]AFJ03174.1 putative small secreted protein [Methylophaga frappieri]